MKFNKIILILVVPLNCFALAKKTVSFDQLNQQFIENLSTAAETKTASHKMPLFFIRDNSLDLGVFSDAVVENLRRNLVNIEIFSDLSLEQLDKRNTTGLKILKTLSGTDSISNEQAIVLLKKAHDHEVVGINALEKYDRDPDTGKGRHGFCFGRADYLYYELLKMGISKNSIYKLFQIGNIDGDPKFGRPWSNHIVTIIHAKTGGWYALDPFYNEVMSPEAWYLKNREFAKNRGFKTLLYLGNPERMYAQGGTNTMQGISDMTFPIRRSQVMDGNNKIIEDYFQPKSKYWKLYYSDLVKDVLATNNGPFAEYFCQTSKLCGPQIEKSF